MRARVRSRAAFVVLVALFALVGGAAAGSGQESDGERDRLLAEGRVVYDASCVACHQANGEGLAGAFPPLVGNDRVADTVYFAQVVSQGLQGEIVVDGVTYNGVMPAFTALSEDELGALTVFVQEGLGAPAPLPPPETSGGADDVAGTDLPFGVVVTYGLGFLVFLAAAAFVLGPVVMNTRREEDFTPVQVWLKAALIVLYFVIATVVIPSLVVESGLLATPPSVYTDLFSSDTWGTVRDLVGAGVWFGALAFGIWMLRRAQKNRVI